MARTKNAEKSGFGLGIHILQYLVDAPAPQGVSQVAKALGLAVSTTHDTLHLLMELGFVEMREDTKTYLVTPRLLDLAAHIANHFTFNARVRQALLDFSHKEGLSACLCLLDGCVSRIAFASGPLGSTVVIGAGGPVFATSAGKVMVASRPEAEWEAFMPAANAPHCTPDTNTPAKRVSHGTVRRAKTTSSTWRRRYGHARVNPAAPWP